MFGYERRSGIPYLRTHSEALAHYEKVVPIRGSGENAGKRPLGRRGAMYYTIDKVGEDITCNHSNDPVVTFRPNGTILIKQDKYSIIGVAMFITEILRNVYACQKDYALVIWQNNYGDSPKYRIPKAGMEFTLNDGVLVPTSPVRNVVHHINRKEANNVRSLYGEFRTYMLGATKVRGGIFPYQEYRDMYGEKEEFFEYGDGTRHSAGVQIQYPKVNINVEGTKRIFSLIEAGDPQSLNEAVLILAFYEGSRDWRVGFRASVQVMERALDKFLYSKHRDTVFKEVEVPEGKLRKDRWGYMFD